MPLDNPLASRYKAERDADADRQLGDIRPRERPADNNVGNGNVKLFGARLFGNDRDREETGDAGLGKRERDAFWFENKNPYGGQGTVRERARQATERPESRGRDSQ